MDMTYNNLRGIEQFKNKLTSSLQKRNSSQDDIEKCVETAVNLFGDKIGVMPVGGFVSAAATMAAIENHLNSAPVVNIVDAISSFNMDAFVLSSASGSIRLAIDDVREEGREVETVLDESAQAIQDSVEDTDNLVSVMAYDEKGNPVREFQVSSIDMIDYMEEEDLTDEGRRRRGFLPANFDSTDVLSETESTEGSVRNIGSYGYDSKGELYIQSPSGNRDVIPVGAGTYMCLETGEVFDVDLLLDDLNPEMS